MLLRRIAGPDVMVYGRLRPWVELMVRAYGACGGQARTYEERRTLEIAVAAYATSVWTVEVLDDLADGDEPEAGKQAPNVALALVGEGTSLLARLPAPLSARLVAYWGSSWARCAAAQALDVSMSTHAVPTVDQSLAVARGSGLVTRWAVEAGALVAGSHDDLIAPLGSFGEHIGTSEKILHDLHDLWPGPHSSHDLRRPCCTLALAIARESGVLSSDIAADERNEDTLRRLLLDGGSLHLAWAYADHYRLNAASALDAFTRVGGDPSPLATVLALPHDLRVFQP